MLLAERRVPSGKAVNNKYWMRAITIVFLIVLSCFNWVYATNVAFDTSEGTATTGVITRKRMEKGTKHRMSYYREVSKPLTNETNTFSVSKSDYNRYDEQWVVTVTEYAGVWGAPYYDVAAAGAGELTWRNPTNSSARIPLTPTVVLPRGDFWRWRWWRLPPVASNRRADSLCGGLACTRHCGTDGEAQAVACELLGVVCANCRRDCAAKLLV